ncbi:MULTISPECIES: leucine-rich repeat domain-containing protein [unclassified Treponema]|uniref:leucine-rich repeat domain-containing protein n=1 Tax=unclassified Treponema TaxID=2638727 RepID=UPI0020A40AEE|nr:MULTISPECIES: leucine-rich repeat domain-containing protein [unclassified Treponema]UTC67564.1 leucine-rich repeat domain-containing protein [Treponema sp. OMZ 789]UTC70292.1 leucine-rich repeat domain-containing protein [Treponema sp. OMZ 790]UTC73007.1 leucine-rich repeat domain-containing protein [Treponema sp. OMZ 791]
MKNTKQRTAFLRNRAAVLTLAASLLLVGLFTACPNAAGGGGSAYVQVAYTELETYLANTASVDKVNYIEITGISKDGLAGKVEGSNAEAGELGKKIQAHPAKKVALKLPGKVAGLDSMLACFFGCTNLVSVANIPEGVTNMEGCFANCTSLTESPVIPASVTDMGWCFGGCTRLTKAPVIPESVTNMYFCFSGCKSLTESPSIPASVRYMGGCFYGSTSLTKAPDIPANVTDMHYCFADCTSLTKAPDIPANVTNMHYCFKGCSALKGVKLLCNYDGSEYRFMDVFEGCTALEAGGIKVKNEHYDAYTDPAALDKMKVPGDDEAAKKAKFSTF